MESVALSKSDSFLRKLLRSHAWRIPATGLGFGLFGLGASVLSLSVFPLLYCLPLNQRLKEKCTRWVIAVVFRNYLRALYVLGLISYDFHQIDELRRPGQLIIANHPSLLDVVFLMALTKNASCVVKGSLWRNPFTAMAVRAANYISNSDTNNLFQRCVETLQRGNSLIIFPEGTRTQPGQPLSFHRGPSNIAFSASVDITPVVIRCEPAALLKHQKWYNISERPPHFTIRVMPTINTGHYRAEGQFQSMAARQLTRDLIQYFTVHTQS